MKGRCKIAFAAGTDDLIPTLLEEMEKLPGDLPIYVVGEFPPPWGKWIPWNPGRSFAENYERMLDDLEGNEVVFAGILLQPKQPYWDIRWAGLRAFGLREVFYNHNQDHCQKRPLQMHLLQPLSLRQISNH
ncbi:MAG: hypothetical protein ACK6D7_05480, partial [Acidobacteriota bacterium]